MQLPESASSPRLGPSGVGAGGASVPISPRVNPPGFVSATAVLRLGPLRVRIGTSGGPTRTGSVT